MFHVNECPGLNNGVDVAAVRQNSLSIRPRGHLIRIRKVGLATHGNYFIVSSNMDIRSEVIILIEIGQNTHLCTSGL